MMQTVNNQTIPEEPTPKWRWTWDLKLSVLQSTFENKWQAILTVDGPDKDLHAFLKWARESEMRWGGFYKHCGHYHFKKGIPIDNPTEFYDLTQKFPPLSFKILTIEDKDGRSDGYVYQFDIQNGTIGPSKRIRDSKRFASKLQQISKPQKPRFGLLPAKSLLGEQKGKEREQKNKIARRLRFGPVVGKWSTNEAGERICLLCRNLLEDCYCDWDQASN